MVLGWRRVFCTSIPQEHLESNYIEQEVNYDHETTSTCTTPKHGNRFRFFSSSPHLGSSPTLRCRTTDTGPARSPSTPLSPEVQYETEKSPRCFLTPSPKSHSPFSFLKSSLRLCTRRCGLCMQPVKKGHGTATFTAECSHTFHFSCISDQVTTQGTLCCPVCSSLCNEMPLLPVDIQNQRNRLFEDEYNREKLAPKQRVVNPSLKVYNDDEPLVSLTPKSRFNPIPESYENCDEVDDSVEEFQGFFNDGGHVVRNVVNDYGNDVEIRLSPEVVVIGASCRHETYVVVLNVKAPERVQPRAPIDLVTVVDVTEKMTNAKLKLMKKAMGFIISCLSSSDRLSIVAFSSQSKRLLPLKRMTSKGKRSTRCIMDAMTVLSGRSNPNDAVKKAVKVLLDRQEKNPLASVVLFSDFLDQSSSVSSIRYSNSRLNILVHSLNLAVTEDNMFAKCIRNLLNVVVQDLRLDLGFVSNSSKAEIVTVYSRKPQPTVLGSGPEPGSRSSIVEIGDLLENEERQLLVEIKVPSPALRVQGILYVRCCYKESFTQEIITSTQRCFTVPRPTTVRSSSGQRLRNLFISTRGLAVSKRLAEGNDLTGACHVLVSARALLERSNLAHDNEFVLTLEAELSELQRRLNVQANAQRLGEPLTPVSAWRVADKLAKAATMRKSVNRVSDLHGFENARF